MVQTRCIIHFQHKQIASGFLSLVNVDTFHSWYSKLPVLYLKSPNPSRVDPDHIFLSLFSYFKKAPRATDMVISLFSLLDLSFHEE